VSKSLRKRINDIENCVLQPVEPGSTKLDTTELSEAEQKLFQKAFEIKLNFELIDSYEPSPTEMRIMDEVRDRLTRRVLDLFTTWAKATMCFSDKALEFLFSVRFWWFMHDVLIFTQQARQESLIFEQKGKSWKLKEKEADETVYKTWNHDLFTRESFTKFYRELTEAKEKHV